MNNYVGVINLDENESNIKDITFTDPLASISIAARYKVIDFVLSNMTNSGVDNIGIFVNNKSKKLINYLSDTKLWDLNRKNSNLRVFNFGVKNLFEEDINNFLENIEFIKNSRKKYVIMAPSYMICNIDYNLVLEEHIKSGNEVTMVYKDIIEDNKNFFGCDVLRLNENSRVIGINKNMYDDKNSCINMEMYVMEIELFIGIVEECSLSGKFKKVKDYLHSNLDILLVGAYKFNGYLGCVNSVNNYYDINMDFLKGEVNKELFDIHRPIYSKYNDDGPTYYGNLSVVSNSVVASECYIGGSIRNSVLYNRVYIGERCEVKNSVLMKNVKVGEEVIQDTRKINFGEL